MSSEPKAVAWQYRERLDEEWGPWLGCDAIHVKRLESREDCQVRPLYGPEALSALRAEVEALRLERSQLLLALKEAVGWNWLDDDMPEGVATRIHTVITEAEDAAMENPA